MGAPQGSAHPQGHRVAPEGLLRAVWPQRCPHMAPAGTATAPSPDPGADPQVKSRGKRGVWLETPAQGWVWAVPKARGAQAGLGWEGRRRGWAGRDPAREMMYGQMYQIAQDKQAVNFIRAHHGFNLAA